MPRCTPLQAMPSTMGVMHEEGMPSGILFSWYAAGSCTQNNTCGGGAFPELMGFQCKGFNPEGQALGIAGRCASNAYDNMGYLTMDFTCATSPCKVDGDCQVVSTHAPSTFCLVRACQCTAISLSSCS